MKRAIAAAAVLGTLTTTAIADHTGSHTWAQVCDTCHTTTPSGTQLNAAGNSRTVLNYVISNQGSMSGYAPVTGLSATQRDQVAQYIRDSLSPIASSVTYQSAKSISVSSHITLGTVAFQSVQTVAGPANGTLSSWSGTSVTYTPDNCFAGSDSFTYRGFRDIPATTSDLFGDARTVSITVNAPLAPTITSSNVASGTVGVFDSYTILPSTACSYTVSGAPTGLTRSGNVISGTPTVAGTFNMTVGASNPGGLGTRVVTYTIAKGSQSITFPAQTTATRTFAAGGTFSINPTATSSSGLAVSYTSTDTSVCTVSGTLVTMQGAGTCTLSANQAGNANYNAAISVQRSVTLNKANQLISFPAQTTASRNWVSGGTFAVNPLATSTVGLPITYGTSTPAVCTASGSTISIQGSAGLCTITADQPGDSDYNPAPQNSRSVTINAVPPGVPTAVTATPGVGQVSISFTAPANNGGSAITGYTADCGGFTNTGATSPRVVTGLANGTPYTCTIKANNAAGSGAPGTANPNPVTPTAALAAPTFTSANGATFTVGLSGNFVFSATGNPAPVLSVQSGALPGGIAFSAGAAGSGTASLGGVPLANTAGVYDLVILADGTNPDATQNFTLTVSKRSQSISFTPPADRPYSSSSINLVGAATATSGLAVTFTTSTPSVCTVSGTLVTMVDVGTCKINADQAGDGTWSAAGTTSGSFQISQTSQVITFGAQTPRTFSPSGTFSPNPPATASSGLPVAYMATTPAVCSVAGSTVTILATGTCSLVASQGGDSRFTAAADVQQDVTIGQASQSITFNAQVPATRSYSPSGTFQVNPLGTATSGLTVSYSSLTTGVCTVSGTTVTIVTTGTCTIAADQAGNANFTAAAQVTRNVTIGAAVPGAPTIGTATPGSSQASIAFTPPASDGGSTITSYTATCNPGNITANGPASPVVVTGLTNNTQYTCSVKASNAAGASAASATVAVTPAANIAGGQATWNSVCSACHGPVPGGTRFNAANTDRTVLDHVLNNQPTMKNDAGIIALRANDPLKQAERDDIVAFLNGYLPAVQLQTAPSTPRQVSVSTNLTLIPQSTANTYTHVEVVQQPANGTLSAFNGVLVTYTPNPGYVGPDSFVYRGANSNNPALVSSDRTVTINVSAAVPVLTVQLTGGGSGEVMTLPEFTICSTGTCSNAFDAGTLLTLSPLVNAPFAFTGWGGACSGTDVCVLEMDASKTAIATFGFTPGTQFALNVSKAGAGGGTVTSSPAGISCPGTCSQNIDAGTSVTLTATPQVGSVFAGWSGACSGTGTCIVAMNAIRNVTATFNVSQGTLSIGPDTLDFGGQSMGTTSPPRTVTLTNTGSAPVAVSAISSSNPQFAVTHACATLAPAATCTAQVRFTPTPVAGPLNSGVQVGGTMNITHDGQGPTSALLTGVAEKSLVTHFYLSILGRAPDGGGTVFWHGEAQRMANLGANVNETWFTMANQFYFSNEYTALGRSDTGFVTDLYNTFFNRAPDGGGLGFWTGQLAQGIPREVVLVSFMFSNEFVTFTQAIFGNTTARPELDVAGDFYRGLLSRLPDTAGFNFWVNRFRTAQCQGAAAVNAGVEDISSGFALGPEYGSRGRTNGQYVGDLYNAFLRRGGDAGGVQFWIGALNGGTLTREQVRQAFVGTPEFQGRVAGIIAAGCLP